MKKIILLILSIFLVTTVFSFNINFSGLGNLFKRKTVGIHFKAGGNDFGGFFFVNGTKNVGIEEIELHSGNKKTNCTQKIKGYYYNDLHGQIMYPLDNETKTFWQNINTNNYKDLVIEGGLYTLCDEDIDSIHGQITYYKGTKKLFSLQAGLKYKYLENRIKVNGSSYEFADNLQKIYTGGTTNILGFLYDSSYGIGFVGGKVNNGFQDLVNATNNDKVKNVITKIGDKIENTEGSDIDTIYGIGLGTNLVVKGLIGLGSDTHNNSNIIKNFKKFSKINKTVILKSSLVNISNILNKLRKNSSILCTGIWNKRSNLSNINNLDSDIGNTICIKTNNSNIKILDDITLDGKSTNIIIKGINNKLIIKKSQEGPGYINIFVDNGYVLFDNNMNQLGVDGNGELADIGGVGSGAIFNGNIYANGLIAGYDTSNNVSLFDHKMYIYGSIASLNTIGENINRLDYIDNLGLNRNYTDITEIFNWECMGLTGTDGLSCGDANDKYGFNSIVIKKRQYKNTLLK